MFILLFFLKIRDIENNHDCLVGYVTRITGCKLVEDGVRDHWHGPFSLSNKLL